MKRRKKDARDDLLFELSSRFTTKGLFSKSELLHKKQRDAIWVDSNLLNQEENQLFSDTLSVIHPDLEVLLEKYDAWIEPVENCSFSGYWVFIKLKNTSKAKNKAIFNPVLRKAFRSIG